MIKIQDATVETLDDSQARPMGSTVLSVTFGGHTFNLLADADEVMEALTIHNGGVKPCMTPAPCPPPHLGTLWHQVNNRA